MDSLKRALKGIFKRSNKKSKQEPEKPSHQQQPQRQPEQSSSLPIQPSKAPQLPPHQDASPLQGPGTQEASKALPPTHPLATGQHSQPQEAVPINHDAQPEPLTPVASTVEGARNEDRIEETEEHTSPLDSRAGEEGTKAEHSLAEQNNDPVASLPGTSQSEAQEKSSAPAATDLNDPLVPSTKTDSAIGEAQHAQDTPKENLAPSSNAQPDMSEEKVAVAHEEPPPIKAVRAAPGMSATSGPLEDFPEGGEHHA